MSVLTPDAPHASRNRLPAPLTLRALRWASIVADSPFIEVKQRRLGPPPEPLRIRARPQRGPRLQSTARRRQEPPVKGLRLRVARAGRLPAARNHTATQSVDEAAPVGHRQQPLHRGPPWLPTPATRRRPPPGTLAPRTSPRRLPQHRDGDCPARPTTAAPCDHARRCASEALAAHRGAATRREVPVETQASLQAARDRPGQKPVLVPEEMDHISTGHVRGQR